MNRLRFRLRHKLLLAITAVTFILLLSTLVRVVGTRSAEIAREQNDNLNRAIDAFQTSWNKEIYPLKQLVTYIGDSTGMRSLVEDEIPADGLHSVSALSQLVVQADELCSSPKRNIRLVLFADPKGTVLVRLRRESDRTTHERVLAPTEAAHGAKGPGSSPAQSSKLLHLVPCNSQGVLLPSPPSPGAAVHASYQLPVPEEAGGADPKNRLDGIFWANDGVAYQLFASALSVKRKVVAYLYVGVPLEDDWLDNVNILSNCSAVIIQDGQVVRFRSLQETLRNRESDAGALEEAKLVTKADVQPTFSRMLEQRATSVTNAHEQLEIAGVRFLAAYQPLPGHQGAVVLLSDLDQELRKRDHLIRQLATLGFLVLCIAVGVNSVISGRLLRPIEALTQGMNRVANGDREVSLAITSQDEIGQLTHTFNKMVLALGQLSRMVSDAAFSRVDPSKDGGIGITASRRIDMSVLFSDVRDFTTISERLSAEQVVELINDHFAEMCRIIRLNGGDIDKFIGDAIMAKFHGGAGQNHAASAVVAAVQMQESCDRRNAERRAKGEHEVRIGVGINSGEVVEGPVGAERFEITVLGDVVNVASRLEAFCKNGRYTRVVISQMTYDRVRELVDVVPLEQTFVKGKSQEVRMYEIERLRPAGMKSDAHA